MNTLEQAKLLESINKLKLQKDFSNYPINELLNYGGETKIICNDKNVTLSIDLFSIGVIFFIKKNQKENFKLIHRSNFF